MYKNSDIILPRYKSLVRPKFEYRFHVWSSHLKKDISLLERVQRSAIKMIDGLADKDYFSISR